MTGADETMSPKLRTGALVCLPSGGPQMTAHRFRPGDAAGSVEVECLWMDQDGTLHSAWIDAAALLIRKTP